MSWDAYRNLSAGNINLALLDEIQKQLVTPGGQIDAKHVVVFGYSQGGYLGSATASTARRSSPAPLSSPLEPPRERVHQQGNPEEYPTRSASA